MRRQAFAFAVVMLGVAWASSGAAGTYASVTSTNWSGYIDNGATFTVAAANFNVPNLTAATTATSTSEWVGVDGSHPDDRTMIQAGVRETYDPGANVVHYYVWWEILPALETNVSLPIGPGDRMHVSIGRVGAGSWRIDIANLTRGKSFSTVRPYRGPGRSGDWIVEAPSTADGVIHTLGHYVPDVTFGNVGALGNGVLQPVVMVQHGKVVSEVSRLQPHGFTVSYRG